MDLVFGRFRSTLALQAGRYRPRAGHKQTKVIELMTDSSQSTSPMSQRRWQELAILFLLVYNTFIGGSFYGVFLFYPRLITQALYFGLILLWLNSLLRQKRPFPRSLLDLPLLVLGGIILVATVFSIEPRLSLEDIILYFIYVMIYYMVIDRLRAGWQVSAFLKGLVMTTIVVCVFAGLEYLAWYIGLPIFPAFKQGWWSIGGWRDPVPPHLYRLAYTLQNANALASLLASVLPIGAAVAIVTRSRWTRINAIAWVLVNTLILLLTFSRGGLVAALAGLLSLAFIIIKRWGLAAQGRRSIAHNPRVILLVGGSVLAIAMLLIASPVAQMLRHPRSTEFRFAVWHHALLVIQNYPLIGTGPHTFGAAVLRYWDPTQYPVYPQIFNAHNAFLHAGVVIGIPGALTIVLIALLVIRAGYRQCTRLPFRQSVLAAGFLSGLMAFATHSIVDNLLPVPAIALPIIVMAAICSAELSVSLSLAHPFLTPRRGLLLTAVVGGCVVWSLYGTASFENFVEDAQSGQWASAAERLDKLPTGTIPPSFHYFQRGLAYGKLALDDPASNAIRVAITSYRDGLAMMPAYVPGHSNLAALYWRLGNVPDTRRELQTAITYEPNTVLYPLNLGLLYEQQEDGAAAIAAYAQALARAPSLAESVYWQETDWRRQHWPLIRNEAEAKIEQISPPEVVNTLRGELAYFSGDPSQAADLFRLGVTTTNSPEANVWLSQALIDQGRFQEASTILDDILEMPGSRGFSQAYLIRGQTNLALGQENEAVHDLKTALFLGNSRAQYYLGQLALNKGDLESAISLYRQSLPNLPNLLTVNSRYDLIVYRRGGMIYESNLLPLAVLPPSASMAETYLELADLYETQGEIEAARQICQQLLDLSPDYQPARNKLEALSR